MSLKRKLLITCLFVLPVFLSLGIYHQIFKYGELIAQAKEKKHRTRVLINELKESSDHFTRIARAHAVTGKSIFAEDFKKIMKDGIDFSIKRLDFLEKAEKEFHSSTPIIRPLKRDIELIIKKAKLQSNLLSAFEEESIHAMNGLFKDKKGQYTIKRSPDQKRAMNLLYSQKYQRKKRDLMYFLVELSNSIERKAIQEIDIHKVRKKRFFIFLGFIQILFILLMLIPLFFFIQSFKEKRDEDNFESSSLFSRKFWTIGRPFILFSLLMVLVVALAGYGLYQELVFVGEGQLRQNMKYTLDSISDAVVSWINRKEQTTVFLSESLEKYIKTHDFHSKTPSDFHKKIKRMEFFDSNQFDDYIIADPHFIVVSSSQNHLIGKKLGVPDPVLNKIKNFPYRGFSFPERKMGQSFPLLGEKVLFASALKKGKKGFLFLLVSPNKDMVHLVSRGFYQTSERYMVNSRGNLVVTSRLNHELRKKGWLKPGMNSAIGIRASQNVEDPKSSLSHAVDEVIHGRILRDDRGKNENGLARYKNYAGLRVFGIWQWNSPYQFGLIVEIGYDEIYMIRNVFMAQTSLGLIGVSFLILLFTVFFIKNRVEMTNINSKLNRSYKTIKNQNEKIAEELLLGQKVQMDMLPEKIKGQGFELEAYLEPAQMMSGDFYDFSFIDNKKKIYFCLGDVSGKGVGAALFMSMTKTLLNKTLDSDPNMDVKDLVSIVNRELSINNASCMFVTLAVGIMDIETGELYITNAGHNSPYIKKSNGELILLESVDGPMVGTFKDISFKQQSIKMGYGDILVLYTDGVTDAQDISENFYSEDRLEKILGKGEFSSALHVIDTINKDIMDFIGKQDQFDDITILSLRYT